MKELHIGFSGSRLGMTRNQKTRLFRTLSNYKEAPSFDVFYFHHGDCVGADNQAAKMAKNLGWKIVSHPPTNKKLRAFSPADILTPEKLYLERNRDIVNASKILLVAPRDTSVGTIYTINYATRKGKTILIMSPQ